MRSLRLHGSGGRSKFGRIMISLQSRTVERITLYVGFIGVAGTAAALIAGSGSKAWAPVLLVIISGAALIIIMAAVYLGVSAARLRRFSASSLQQASRVTDVSSANTREILRDLLSRAARDVAGEQHLEESVVRAALFRQYGEVLRIVPGLTWHMNNDEELQIEIGPGEGSAGKAFITGQPNIAIYHQVRSDTSISDVNQRSRVDPNLKWIISTPILGQKKEILGVLNVDGLMIERTAEQLESCVGTMAYWSQLAGLVLGANEEGDEANETAS